MPLNTNLANLHGETRKLQMEYLVMPYRALN